jgi:hypothetical protein
MPVDPTLKRKVLVVHGVQSGDAGDLHQDRLIDDLIRSRLGNIPLDYECELYAYEGIADEALAKYQTLLKLLIQNPVGAAVAGTVLDLVGDVVISLLPGDTADLIRAGLREKIMAVYRAGQPCYIVAHSLGSIYAFDVLNELLREEALFQRASRRTWPVQGLLTIGSPIGLDMFRITGRDRIADLGPGQKWLRWLNLWDPNDPVVSGNLFGTYLQGNKIAERFLSGAPQQGWVIRDIVTDTGRQWLQAHTAYWHSPMVGDKLVDMVAS